MEPPRCPNGAGLRSQIGGQNPEQSCGRHDIERVVAHDFRLIVQRRKDQRRQDHPNDGRGEPGSKLLLQIAANYGGRWDIVEAAKALASQSEADFTEAQISERLSTKGVPDPDLFIRTGGERRISNFLLWQLAYSELYFTDLLWPDFDEEALLDAIQDFSGRQRRFGMTGEQVKEGSNA